MPPTRSRVRAALGCRLPGCALRTRLGGAKLGERSGGLLVCLHTGVALMGGGRLRPEILVFLSPGVLGGPGNIAPHLLAGFPGLRGPPRLNKFRIPGLSMPPPISSTPVCGRMTFHLGSRVVESMQKATQENPVTSRVATEKGSVCIISPPLPTGRRGGGCPVP